MALSEKLHDLEKSSGGAPLVCVTDEEVPNERSMEWKGADVLSDDGRSDADLPLPAAGSDPSKREEWEML